jgi:transposase
VVKWLQRYCATGSVAPAKIGGHVPPKIADSNREWLLGRIEAGNFTLQGLADELEAERGLKVDYRTMWNFVHAHGLSFKKNRSRRRTAKA